MTKALKPQPKAPTAPIDGVSLKLILTVPQYNKLREESDATGAPMASIIRRAIDAKYAAKGLG